MSVRYVDFRTAVTLSMVPARYVPGVETVSYTHLTLPTKA